MSDSLVQVTRLWPGATLSRRPGRGRSLLVLPSARKPRMLVPGGVPSAAVMLSRHSEGRLHTLGQRVVALGVRTGALRLLPVPRLHGWSDASVEQHVRAHVPESAHVGVLLGPPRANAKPVLQVFGADGRTLAFGKVGDGAEARGLVAHEAAVLADPALGTLGSVDVPRVIDFGQWRGLDVLLLTALGSSQRRASSWDLPAQAMHEVAESTTVTWSSVGDSPYWSDLVERVGALATPRGERVQALAQGLGAGLGGTSLGFGRWHGDWAPWNMGFAGGRLELWDWEQSSTGVPLGFDAVHFVLQRLFRDAAAPEPMLAALLAETPRVLDRWYSDPAQVRATVSLYVLEILTRYVAQATGPETAQLSTRLAALLDLAERLNGRSSVGGGSRT